MLTLCTGMNFVQGKKGSKSHGSVTHSAYSNFTWNVESEYVQSVLWGGGKDAGRVKWDYKTDISAKMGMWPLFFLLKICGNVKQQTDLKCSFQSCVSTY